MKIFQKTQFNKWTSTMLASMVLVCGAIELKAERPTYRSRMEQKKNNQEQAKQKKTAKASKKPRLFRFLPGLKLKKNQANRTNTTRPVTNTTRPAQKATPSNSGIRQVQYTTESKANITNELELLYQQDGRPMPAEMRKTYKVVATQPQGNNAGVQNPSGNNQIRVNQPQVNQAQAPGAQSTRLQAQNNFQNPNQNLETPRKKKPNFFKRLFKRKPRTQTRQAKNVPNRFGNKSRRTGIQQASTRPQQLNRTRMQQNQGYQNQGQRNQGQRNQRIVTQTTPVAQPAPVTQKPVEQENPLPVLPAPEDIATTEKSIDFELPPEKATVQSKSTEKSDKNFFEVTSKVAEVEESLIIPDVPEEEVAVKEESAITFDLKEEAPKEEDIAAKLNRGEFENPFTEVSEEEADSGFATVATAAEETSADSDDSEESPFSGLILSEEENKTVNVNAEETKEVSDDEFNFSSLTDSEIKPLAEKAIKEAKPIAKVSSAGGLKGYCPVSLRNERKLVKADKYYRSRYQYQVYYFSSSEAKSRFDENPHFYAPVEGGQDVTLLVTEGQKVSGNVNNALWYKGRLFLFSSPETKSEFTGNPEKYTQSLF